MRLLRAELAKLRRPLLWWATLALLALVGLIGWGGLRASADFYAQAAQPGGPFSEQAPRCADMGLPEGSECEAQQALHRATVEQERDSLERELAVARALQHPVGIAVLAAGMLASFPGAVVLVLLAAGHVGNEWSGRTIRSVLLQEGRRWRVLAAKLASLWLVATALLGLVWAGLALLTPWFRGYRLPGDPTELEEAWALAWPQLARSLLVLAAFVVIGVLAAVVVRNTLGTFFLAFGFLVASMIVAGFAAATRATLAWWVSGWMGWEPVFYAVPLRIWRDAFPQGAPAPTQQAGLAGLAGLLVLGTVAALVRFARSDVQA